MSRMMSQIPSGPRLGLAALIRAPIAAAKGDANDVPLTNIALVLGGVVTVLVAGGV